MSVVAVSFKKKYALHRQRDGQARVARPAARLRFSILGDLRRAGLSLGLRAAGRFFLSSRRRHTIWTGDWSSDVCSSDLQGRDVARRGRMRERQPDMEWHQAGL